MMLGDIELRVVSGGTFRMDGGAMFGGVPRPLWERFRDSDELGRIVLATNCLLVRTAGKTILVDTGYGAKSSEKARAHYSLETGDPLVRNLRSLGVGPEAIDLVILTHLHFDHAGGCVSSNTLGESRPTFPNAEYVVQKWEWEDANANLPELAGAYDLSDYALLRMTGQLRIVEGDAVILPGVSVARTGGHTRGHQVVRLESGENEAIYLADICPLAAHLHPLWTTAYDQYPLATRRVKLETLRVAAARRQLVIFGHEPDSGAAYIRTDTKRQFAIDATRCL